MLYEEIIAALRNYSELVEAGSQKFEGDIVSGPENTDADFEDAVCAYVDALNEIKRVRNRNKRYCLVYDALGYEQFMIAEVLRMNQSTVCRNIKWLKIFFNKVNIKGEANV
ncbi:MAG: hypothetical protein ACYCXQ_00920 [Candidatus Humimicrobiaceae bacterium]